MTGWQGEPRIANDEHSEIRWCTAADLASLKLQPHLKKVLRALLPKNV